MKRVLFIAWFALFAMAGSSQIKFGAKAGLALSNQLNPVIYSFSIKPSYSRGQSMTGLNAGIFTQLNLGEKFLLRIQLAVVNEGYKLPQYHDDQGNLVSPSQKVRLGYLALPVQINYQMKIDPGTIWIGAGPYVGLLTGGHVTLPSGNVAVTGNSSTDKFKSFDFGISPTIGLTLNSGLSFGVDYNLGLSDVSKTQENSKNICWSFYIAYIFKNQ